MPITLYHTPMTCSLAVRMTAAEAEIALHIEPLNLTTKELESGGSFYDINPLGQVSALRLETGELITETATCLVWVQAQANNDFCVKPTDARYFQMLRWINFCATELHKQLFRIVFYSEVTEADKDKFRALALTRLAVLDKHLSSHTYLTGDQFCAADMYLAWFSLLANQAQVELESFEYLKSYCDRLVTRPSIAKLVKEDQRLKSAQH